MHTFKAGRFLQKKTNILFEDGNQTLKTRPGIFFFIRFTLTLVLAVGILALVGVIAYNSLHKMVSTIADEAQPNTRLILLKEIQYDLSDAELNARTYSITGKYESLKPFYENVEESSQKLNELYRLSVNNQLQKYRIDSIKGLVNAKIDLMRTLISLKEDTSLALSDLRALKSNVIRLNNDTNKALEKINPTENNNTEKTDPDNYGNDKKKKGFFKRIFGKKDKKEKAAEEIKAGDDLTDDKEMPAIKVDTAKTKMVEEITSHIDKISKSQQARKAEQMQRELELISDDKMISNNIRGIIAKIEEEEQRESLRMARLARQNADYTTQIIFLLSVITVVVLIASGITVYTYMKVNQKYRKVLNEAKTKAERLAKLRLEFLSNMSHEIRTPLNAIVGFSEQLGKQKMTASQEESVRIIKDSSEHLATLINDVLDHAKMESGRFSFEEISFKPADVLRQVNDFFIHEAQRKAIGMELVFVNHIPEYVCGDPLRLKQILVNLVSNALKFTSRGSVKVEVASREQTQDAMVLEVTVSDSGIGIAPEKLKLIFDEYTQADSSTSRKYGGTGLGLTITKKLIELQGGTIEVKSQLKKGSAFTVAIPYGISEADGVLQNNEVRFKDLEKIKKLRVLVADDENYNRLLLEHIFEKWELKIDMAIDGTDVLDKLSVDDYDVILMDVRMPYMDGVEASRKIRESFSGHKRNVPIIAITAGASIDDKKNCLSAGMNAFITKPFKESELVKVMGEILKLETESVSKDKKPINGSKSGIDLTELEQLTGNDHEFIKKMIASFIESSASSITEMEDYMKNKDLRSVGLVAHRLAAPARHMGFHGMADKLKRIEKHEEEKLGAAEINSGLEELRKEITDTNIRLQYKLEEFI